MQSNIVSVEYVALSFVEFVALWKRNGILESETIFWGSYGTASQHGLSHGVKWKAESCKSQIT